MSRPIVRIRGLTAFTIYAFTQHPDIVTAARAEVLEHVGPDGTPDSNELKQLKYLKILSLLLPLPSVSWYIKHKQCATRPFAYSRRCTQAYGNPNQLGYCFLLPILPTHGGHCTFHLPRRSSTSLFLCMEILHYGVKALTRTTPNDALTPKDRDGQPGHLHPLQCRSSIGKSVSSRIS